MALISRAHILTQTQLALAATSQTLPRLGMAELPTPVQIQQAAHRPHIGTPSQAALAAAVVGPNSPEPVDNRPPRFLQPCSLQNIPACRRPDQTMRLEDHATVHAKSHGAGCSAAQTRSLAGGGACFQARQYPQAGSPLQTAAAYATGGSALRACMALGVHSAAEVAEAEAELGVAGTADEVVAVAGEWAC